MNLKEIKFQGLEQTETIDITKKVGQALFYASKNKKGAELGRKIYHEGADITLDEEEKKILLNAVDKIYASYVITQAVKQEIYG
ncbi:MAG: hypothetical protein II314_07075 [Prevotella sp.]|nr:hypothetical protein [Prevotella sp.]